MRTVALAARQWYVSTWIASGVRPLSAPPVRLATFDPAVLSGAGLLYVCLHGLPGQPFWYGSTWETAVSADQIDRADLRGAVVYLAGCYGQGPMTDALLAAGAAAVVGDSDLTHAGYFLPTGSNGLGRLFVRALRAGLSAADALGAARFQYGERHRDAKAVAMLDTVALAGDGAARLQGV